MPGGFLLDEDARASRMQQLDDWVKEQEDNARRTAAAAVSTATQAVQPAVQAVQAAPSAIAQQADAWVAQQEAQRQQQEQAAQAQAAQAAQAAAAQQPATPPPTPQALQPTDTGNLGLGQQADLWIQQQQQAARQAASNVASTVGDTASAAGTAAQAALPHSEEPATQADTHGGPDLGQNWKTQFDFGATYTGDYRTGTPHRGVDLVPSNGKGIGTEVDAFEPGTVTNVFKDPGGAGGLIVYVQDSDGLTHAYMHLASAGVKVGDQVSRGTPIAQMGESGTEGSPHLHYEVRKNASNGDPLNQLIDPRPYVSGEKQPGGQPSTQGGTPPVATAAAAQTSGTGQGSAPPSTPIDASSPQNFGKSVAPYAQYAAQKLGIDPTWVAAMMASESNYGKAPGNELFGVKGGGTAGSQTLATHEGEFGGTAQNADFAAYNSPLESVDAWIDLIKNHYKGAVGAQDLPTFVHGLKQGGYFTANEGEYLGIVQSIANNIGSAVQSGVQAVGGAVGNAASAVGTAASNAGQAALNTATSASGQVASRAQDLVNQGKTQLQQLQDQTAQLQQQLDDSRARLQAAQDEAARQNDAWRANVSQGISQTQDELLKPRDFSGTLNAATQTGQDILGSNVAQRVGQTAGSVFDAAPSPTGGTLGSLRQDIQNAPENLSNLGTGLAAVPAVAEREANQDTQVTQGVGAVKQLLTGQDLGPEERQLINQVTPPMLSSAHAGGVVAQFLKDAQIVPASQTVNLPFIGATPIADIVGLAADTIMPMGAEERFAASAEQRAINRAAFEVAQRAGGGGLLERGGTQAAWAAALGDKAGSGAMAARTAISAAGKWARASIEDIASDLARGPIGNLVRDESGNLDIDKLTQIASRVKEEMVRVYSGTVGEYDRADLSKANPEGLYGPGYYTTDNPQIAGGRVSEPESGWAARYGREDQGGVNYGKIFPTQAEALADAAKQRADMLAQYSGLKPKDVPMPLIVERSQTGGQVIEPGYAQAAGERAGLGDQGTIDSLQNNIARSDARIADMQQQLTSGNVTKREAENLQANLRYTQQERERFQASLDRATDQPAGPAVRPLDVPKSLNLLDMDNAMTREELTRLSEHAASKGMFRTDEILGGLARRVDPAIGGPTGADVYQDLQRQAGLSKAQIQDFLESAGYHGITHEGGAIRPMMDEGGQPIQHQTRVLFQSGLDRSRTLAGTQAGAIPNAAIGGAVGSQTGDEDQTPQDRLLRGVGGAFVAGIARKNPVVAAYEAQGLRKGATYRAIADAVQAARTTAGKVNKFAGPIADAAEAAFNKAPGADQVVAAREMLRGFGDKAALLRAAPPNAQTDSGAARLHNFLTELAQQGASQRHWYTDASQAILEATGGDKARAEKLAQLFAIYSPGATVSANTQMALGAWHQFLEGVPIAIGKTDLDKKAQALLYDNKPWDGRKTNNFYRNLMKRIDPDVWASMGKEDGQTGTTVDIWMMRAMRYLQDAPSMGPKGQYEFAQRAIERVAKDLGWQPDEAQAAIWSAYKAATEGSELQEAGYHYGTGLAERSGRVGELAGQAPEAVANARDDLQRVFGLFGQEGAPALPAEKGSRTLYNPDGTPIYNPKKLAQGTKEALSENIPEAKGMISAAASKTVSAYAAARAWLEKLPEISWARVFPDNKPTLRDANALVANVGRPLTEDEINTLQSQLGPNVSVTATKDGAWIINHDGSHVREPNVPGGAPEDNLAGQWVGSSNRDFHKTADAALRGLDTVQEASTYPLRADTNTLTNDWSTSPNGEDYAHVINGSARAGAFWDVADPLAKRVAEATGGDAEHAASIPDLRAGAEPSPDIPGRVPGAADYEPPTATPAGNADAAAAGAAPEDGAAAAGEAAAGGRPGNAVRDFLTGEGSERGSISLGAMGRLGGAGAGVASQEATMSDEDKSDPFGRFSRDAAAAILGAAAPGTVRALARGSVGYQDLKAVRPGFGPPVARPAMNNAQKFSAYTKQNLLSGAKTSVTNIASQLVELAHQPLGALASGHEDDAMAGIKASAQSVPDALRNFAKTLTTGETQFTQSQGATSKWLPALRLLAATDDFFRTMGWAMGAGMEGQRILRESGATASSASSILGSNSARISAAGDKAGAMSVFSEGAGSGDNISRIKNRLLGSSSKVDQMYGLFMDAGIPFAAVPGRIWNTGVKRIPGVGEVLALRRAGIAIQAGDQYAFQKAMGDAAVQSVISASILSNVAKGNIRGPDDKEHPSGIKLNGQWYDYSSWGPWVLPMAMPAAVLDATQKERNKPNPDLPKAWGNALLKTTANQFYAADLVKTLNQVGEGNGMGALNNVALSYADRVLPASAAMNTATQLWDPILRDPANSGMQAFLERWQSKIPGLESKLPAAPNMLTGEPQQRTSSGPGQLIGMQTRPSDKLATTVASLERQGYQIPDPTRVPTQVSLEDSTIPLTEAEGRALAAKRGQLIDRVVGSYVNSPGFEQLTPNQQARGIAVRLADINNDTADNWAQMTPAAERAKRIADNRTFVGRREPVGSGVGTSAAQ